MMIGLLIQKQGKELIIKLDLNQVQYLLINYHLMMVDIEYQMGLKKVAIEIAKKQIELFKEWLDISNENINENMEKGNTIYQDNNIGVKIKDLKNKLVRLSDLNQETNGDKKMSPIYPNMTEKDADSVYFEIKNYIKEFPNEEGLKKVKNEFESGSNKAAGLKYWYKKLYDVFNTRESLKHIKSYKNY